MLIPFSPPPGLNSDDTTFSSEGKWADGSNVRFRDGKPQVIGGWAAGTTLAAGTQCRGLFVHKIGSAVSIYYGMTSKLYFNSAGNPTGGATDVTPAVGFLSVSAPWSFAAWGNEVLFCRASESGGATSGGIYTHTGNTSAAATVVPNAPTSVISMLVSRRQVLAFGCNEEVSGTFNPRCIRGSDFEDYTAWTTSSSNNVFEHILDGEGEIVAAREIGDYIAVWTTTGLWMGQFIGDPGQTYRFDKVADGCGLVHADAVTVHDDARAYWISSDLNFYVWQYGSPPVAIPCPIRRDFAENVVAASTLGSGIGAVSISLHKEIWWFYRDGRGGTTRRNRYIALNTETGTWFRGQMTRTAAYSSGLLERPFTGTYDKGAFIAVDLLSAYIQETGDTAAGSAMDWHIQSADFYLNESSTRMMIRGIIPDFEDQAGDVTVNLYMRDRPHSTAVTKGPYTLTAATTKKDFRASGKIASVKFSGGAATGSYVRLGKQLFDAVPMGER